MDTLQQGNTTIRGKYSQNEQTRKNSYNKEYTNAIWTAVLMTLYTFLIEFFVSSEMASYLKPASYLIMLGFFYVSLRDYKKRLPKGKIFTKGTSLGLYMSAITSVVLMVLMTLLQFIFQQVSFSKFTKEINTVSEMITFDWILLLQTFVFGIIVTFIILQGIKDTSRT